ncbi:hypothetical protein [Paenibacillus elgii]|uniref:Alpha/beta hydrolase n=1 Tax=Paenibacillus elgii TaxID=189691 RepID=A0A163VHP6_9BACL|nr:hypothetical protein [Paenibacillus elgii]KZE74900.1 hypothetical protein AV654_28565 [Paenibacillus elgii]NEN85692.1 hypothetical protein [Paenibacillus elgii]PUA38156.1 hypothetical protein C8Z91_17360 [Paenibacillus elgii]
MNSARKIDVEHYKFPAGRYPCLFVHGKGHTATKDSAYSFFWDIEEHVKIFRHDEYKNHDLYLVSYDTDLTGTDEKIIKAAFELFIKIGALGDPEPLILAVFWRELERRAEVTGKFLVPFLKTLSSFYKSIEEMNGIGPFAITHSLGCYTFATAAQELLKESNENRCFAAWLCMAAAVPSNGFTNTGAFRLAPLIAGTPDGPIMGTSVWYSRTDLVLNIAYTLATGHLAMGVTGPLISRQEVYPEDVTSITKEDHHIAYFKKLSKKLQEDVFKIENLLIRS